MNRCKRVSGIVTSGLLIFSLVIGNVSAPAADAAKKKASLKTKKITVQKGKTKTIQMKNKNAKCKYSFTSSKKKVATVSKKGKVKAVKVGTAKITVKETTKKGKGKTRKVGVVTVKVTKKKSVTPAVKTSQPTATAKTQMTPAPTNQTNATQAPSNPPQATERATAAPTKEPGKGSGTSVKVYMDSVDDSNLIAEVAGPGFSPTPEPTAVGDVEATPVPTPKVIYSSDFEDDSVEPFLGRGSGQPSIDTPGAGDSAKCIKISGRSASWNGTEIDITNDVENGNIYEVSFMVKQVTGAEMKINTTFQYVDLEGTSKYDNQHSQTVPSGEWTEVSFTTKEVPEHNGAISLYWETPYDSDNVEDFYLDDFTFTGIAKSPTEKTTPDLSAGLVKEKIGNPIVTSRLTADPWAMEYNGRIYVYGTNDSQQYEKASEANNNYAKINTLNCYSSADMVNWTDHGTIAVGGSKGAATWANNSWAPAAAHKTIDGKEKFFLYFANSANSIGVLTADSPTGPWSDPIGKELIGRDTPGCSTNEIGWLFDPAVLVDDDGQGYLYFGGIGDTTGKDDTFLQNPACARVIKLGDDMVSTVGNAETIDAPCMFEDSGINKIGDKYYYSYCTSWTDFTGRTIPTAEIAVMESDNPMTGFQYIGNALKNPGKYFGAYGNNHHCFAEFKGKHYAFYHTKKDSLAAGTMEDYRTTYVDKLNLGDNGNFTNTDGTFADSPMTTTGVDAVADIDPFTTVEAETFSMAKGVGTKLNAEASSNELWKNANQSLFNASLGSYVGVSNVDFGSAEAKSIALGLSDTSIEGYKSYTADLSKTVTGKHTIYFVFEKCGVLMDTWKFEK